MAENRSVEEIISEFEGQVERWKSKSLLTTKQIQRKLVLWLIRNLIGYGIIVIFWSTSWIPYTLFVAVPLSMFSLVTILGYNWMIKKRLKSAEESLIKLGQTLEQNESERQADES